MTIIKVIQENETGCQRPMNGYEFDGKAEFDRDAFHFCFPGDDGYELERRIDNAIDDLYDGDCPIYETDIGLCTVYLDWENKLPLCWCKVKPQGLAK